MLPDFLIIGAQKCGTTWLHHHLRAHPDLFLPATKDHGYFCWRGGQHAMSDSEYEALFAQADDAKRVGEATAAYFWTRSSEPTARYPDNYEEDIPGRIRDALGEDAKFIVTLRNPVERAVSAYIHHVSHGTFTYDTPLLDADPRHGIVDIGFYSRHLSNWLKRFDKGQVMILCTEEDISIDGKRTLANAYAFLGVDPEYEPEGPAKPVYSGRARRWHEGEIWVTIGDTISSQRWRRAVDAETLKTLRAAYRPDVRRLSALTGRDFNDIWGLR